MRKIFLATILIGFSIISASLPKTKGDSVFITAESKFPITIIVPISNVFTIGGCTLTVTHGIAYTFESSNGLLIGVAISNNYYIQVNCGSGGPLYTRDGTEISFDVDSHGEITSIDFPSTGITDIDNFFNDSGFQRDYEEWIESEIPTDF